MLTVQDAVLYPDGMARILRHIGKDCAVQTMMSSRGMQLWLDEVSCVSHSMQQAKEGAASR